MKSVILFVLLGIVLCAQCVHSVPMVHLRTTPLPLRTATVAPSPTTTTTTTTTPAVVTTATTTTAEPADTENTPSIFEYLLNYGYLTPVSNALIDLSGALKKMQQFGNIPVTGKLDAETRNLLTKPRCQFPDIIPTSASAKTKRYNAIGKWSKRNLTYHINNYPTYQVMDINDTQTVDRLIAQAFNDWSSVADVNFSRSDDSKADIQIGFYKRDHGDGASFDGIFGVLAHAFFPEDGRMHFDDDEKWSQINNVMNLRQVATHEVGHLLGLAHTNFLQSVMYPFHYYSSDFKLYDDDIQGVISLYGKRNAANLQSLSPTSYKPPATAGKPNANAPVYYGEQNTNNPVQTNEHDTNPSIKNNQKTTFKNNVRQTTVQPKRTTVHRMFPVRTTPRLRTTHGEQANIIPTINYKRTTSEPTNKDTNYVSIISHLTMNLGFK